MKHRRGIFSVRYYQRISMSIHRKYSDQSINTLGLPKSISTHPPTFLRPSEKARQSLKNMQLIKSVVK